MFSPGQLIWAKMWGYPPWPARVSSLKSKQTFLRCLALWNSTFSFAVFLSPFRLIFLQICLKTGCKQRAVFKLWRNAFRKMLPYTRNVRNSWHTCYRNTTLKRWLPKSSCRGINGTHPITQCSTLISPAKSNLYSIAQQSIADPL